MTELEHVEIEGFKGLEHVEFEPTDINLITGRNNTGKTSFLEAVDLLFNPQNVAGFNADLDKIVNINYRESRIRGEGTTDGTEIRIEKPSEEKIKGHIAEAFSQYLRNRVRIEAPTDNDGEPAIEWLDFERLDNIILEVATRSVNENWDDLLPKTKSKCLEIWANNEVYPYVRLRGLNTELLPTAYERLSNFFRVELNSLLNDDEDSVEILEYSNERIAIRKGHERINFELMTYVADKDEFFLNSIPEGEDKVFITEGSDIDIQRIDKEENALKIDGIGDYVGAAGIVDGLKTFTLDYLIFQEEDGEKYDIPFEFMGDGFKSMVGLLWELMDEETENDIVLVEEPETHMHPGYVAELVHFLIDLARDEDIQFFITTHDHDFIKDFFMDMPDEKREYLEDEFSLVKMDDFGADVMDYEDAEHHLKDLHLDLRGI